MKPNPLFLRIVQNTVERSIAVVPDVDDTPRKLGIKSLDLAVLEMDLEEAAGIYTASTHSWAMEQDTMELLAIKLERLYENHKKRYQATMD